MYKYILLIWLFFFTGCNDGDIDIPTFTFQETVYVCKSYLLYRSNDANTEALILNIPAENFSTQETVFYPVTPQNCLYRIFDDAFDPDYFCSDIPPSSPHVVKEWLAVSGDENTMEIIPENTGTDEEPEYSFTLILHHLVLENGTDQIRYDTYNFGTFTLPQAQ